MQQVKALKTIHSSTGLTLIELLVTLTIIGFIFTAVYTFYLAGLQGWNRGVDHMEYQQSARIAMDKIIRELRYAYDINLNQKQDEVHFKVYGDSRTLRFMLQGESLVQNTIPTSHYHTVVALGITGLHFDLDQRGLVLITLTAGRDNNIVVLTGSVRPRNLPVPVMDYEL